jgi:hypothetical protein
MRWKELLVGMGLLLAVAPGCKNMGGVTGITFFADASLLDRPPDGVVNLNQRPPAEILPPPEETVPALADEPPLSLGREIDQVRRRLDELEVARTAHEDATRQVIVDAIAAAAGGSKINEFVTLGGTMEVLTGWREDFEGIAQSFLQLNTAELDFEIQVNPWCLGTVIIQYQDGTNFLFPTNTGDFQSVDRFNVDVAFLTIGDTQQCWPFARVGRLNVPFGITTAAGNPLTDVLTLESPLTVEVFQAIEDVIMFGFEFPTPPPPPPPSTAFPPVPPKVRPILSAPVFGAMRRYCCRRLQPPPLPSPTPVSPPVTPTQPPFSGAVYVYNGTINTGVEDHIQHIGGTLGYFTRRFTRNGIPWSIDADVDVMSSVFDSDFLQFEYRAFLDQIGNVPGMAAHVKASYGPVALVAEWNGAIGKARFFDQRANLEDPTTFLPGPQRAIAPSAWQVSLAYQFDWNPSVEVIGSQGTYFTIGYSESEDLAGVTRVINGVETRVGNVPKRRFLVGLGEWVLDGLRIAVEYAHIVDYSVQDGGTGRYANGWFGQVSYQW